MEQVQYKVVGVRFKRAGKIYYFDPDQWDIVKGNYVIVETARGLEYGEVVVGPKTVEESEVVLPLKKVIRIATESDAEQVKENKIKEKEAFEICQQKIEKHGLEMKLVDVEYTFDASKIIFYFTAEGRIDFRELVKDLAAVFRTRIELRQIGIRDEAKMLGGIGCCGRSLCCSTFLGEFEPVSIKMAKIQNLSLNPTKISGICGRLMCCLRYENDHYEEARRHMPEVGTEVETEVGKGKITEVNPLKGTVKVEIFDSKILVDFPPCKVRVLSLNTDKEELEEETEELQELERDS
ncbi:Cell fate regulator YaaT, PSP1 superfamily (controls sporulation, competence, biofilm development) [Anaerobranca californiensis DSM 14826]|jgi:cell fate regulator YaaT (PSP1 superfamily)|uniref:Cell fate regulator YaaT, PSP1 superfamily (Controls sporulation, competence, biofilm development) n=1 Tax=Anaerobranca californiensis DSM 14826 TaxID=1120989 RepID=A0A1M6PLL8_9FIRM|nr:stage 0 sporulation family protein [Anaerobranca californiensis]SHK08818.1 Cell fate regulator YaaT, PSP1 superfamily (controls sporulation, competence, biofilm development) [Anaerobranca californiensis DSM 14826]